MNVGDHEVKGNSKECNERKVLKYGSHIFYLRKSTIERLMKLARAKEGIKVLIQIPDGFKRCSKELVRSLSSIVTPLKASFEIDASPTVGSCLINSCMSENYDLIIHFGHEPYPLWSHPAKVVFERIECELGLDKKVISDLIRDLRGRGVRRLSLYTTQQHVTLCEVLRRELIRHGFTVVNKESIAFGCYYPELREARDTEAVLVVSGGFFHSLGAGLVTAGLIPIYKVDPYRNEYSDVTDEVFKILKVRYWKINEAIERRGEWLLIIGSEGQYRPRIVNLLIKALKSQGLGYFIARSVYIDRERLMNVDSDDVGTVVITSCPRIPVDDLSDYVKPVLTPGEALHALGVYRTYRFPW